MVRLTLVPIIFFIVVNTVLLKLIQRDNRQLIYNRHRVGLKAKPLASLLFPIISILPREHFTEETVVGFLLVLVVCLKVFQEWQQAAPFTKHNQFRPKKLFFLRIISRSPDTYLKL